MRYSSIINFKINWEAVANQFSNMWNLDKIATYILHHDADIVCLQEIQDKETASIIGKKLWYTYTYTNPTYKYGALIAICSKKSLTSSKKIVCKHWDFTIYSTWEVDFIPVHLHAFSAKIRFEQCQDLSLYIPKNKTVFLWDFNFRQWKDYFLLGHDKIAHQKLCENYTDQTSVLPSTTSTLKMDRVYTTHIQKNDIQVSVYQETGKYMDHYPTVIELNQ